MRTEEKEELRKREKMVPSHLLSFLLIACVYYNCSMTTASTLYYFYTTTTACVLLFVLFFFFFFLRVHQKQLSEQSGARRLAQIEQTETAAFLFRFL